MDGACVDAGDREILGKVRPSGRSKVQHGNLFCWGNCEAQVSQGFGIAEPEVKNPTLALEGSGTPPAGAVEKGKREPKGSPPGRGYWFMATIGTTAYFDDSRTDRKHDTAVVAGLVSTTDMWCGLERKWERLMRDKPSRLPWKKYVQQNCVPFAKLARTFSLKAIGVPIPHSILEIVRRSIEPARKHGEGRVTSHILCLISEAYSFCSFGCCETLDSWAHEQAQISRPVKVVFDAGSSHEVLLRRGYEEYYKKMKRDDTYLSHDPLSDDDDIVLPLQAAHLYSWLLAKKANGDNSEVEALEIICDKGHGIPVIDGLTK
jgi:hypothetical protein